MKSILGVDAGSIAVSAVLIDRNGGIIKTDYAQHGGDPAGALTRMLESWGDLTVGCVAATGQAPDIVTAPFCVDTRVSFITAAKRLHPEMGSLLIVGGEKFGLALFNERGEYMNYRSNTSCAAGTGSFLEQQAKRLNLADIGEFSELSYGNTGNVPKIASRCSVFAKTDLIHAQQEGYSLGEICDGLCYGLAKNVADTLFSNAHISGPMVFAGGVSKNRAVLKHLASMTGAEMVTDAHSHIYGALGAALQALEENAQVGDDPVSVRGIVAAKKKEKSYHCGPLSLAQSQYPDFDSENRYEFQSRRFPGTTPVEVDLYENFQKGETYGLFFGIDIGSTSTKAVLMDRGRRVMAGFYTRTSGRPVTAVQTIFECIDDIATTRECGMEFLGAGTTGSGRKFIAEIIGADTVLDEITAHARAAWELDPETDTIIEIGGQDSKFTTMSNGMVTFSIMNNVCAAGTGSFIEEQAKKLGCPLSDYSRRAEGLPSPLSSDRCTVFMERDLNHYLAEGYTVDEILASVLHSVRDNYLMKVAIEKNIGKRVLFQGATAKNRALVAAFEQRLARPITVSKFCHLTGAMGAALAMCDEGIADTKFRGVGLYRADIPIRTEVCELCTNHCKIRLAEVNGETVAFGFLCGRDYETRKFIRNESAFDLLGARKKAFSMEKAEPRYDAVIGIPAALHLFEELPLWRRFFQNLSLRTVTSEGYREAVKEGKRMSGAEFCAPLTALHGHTAWLGTRCDYVFLPVYVEEPKVDRDHTRNYCYYTQYAPSVVSQAVDRDLEKRILSPVVRSTLGDFYLKIQLYRMLRSVRGFSASFMTVSRAYDDAVAFYRAGVGRLQEIFKKESESAGDVQVMFLGRPYTLLSREMNSGITDIFSKNGIRSYFQDMLPASGESGDGVGQLLKDLHWRFAAGVIETAEAVASMDGIYPVFVTSFKCTPDSYTVEYFKKIMDRHRKPYLILQLDEHDSSVGYETRIEAGIRAFRNHMKSSGETGAPAATATKPSRCTKEELAGKTLLFPRWDSITCTLLEAVLRNHGLDARIVDESTGAIQRSMRMNSGQCIPLTIMLQNVIDYIETHGLDPEKTAVWTGKSQLSCNIGMFPAYKKSLLEDYGRGMEKVTVYSGEVMFNDLSIKTCVNGYTAYMLGGNLRKIGCHIRPYETVKGATDAVMAESLGHLYNALLEGKQVEETVEEVVSRFLAIPVRRTSRPKVAIFGDFYVRENDVLNQDLIRTIEDNGGEVVTTPYSDLMRIVADVYIRKWFKIGKFADAALASVMRRVVPVITEKYEKLFERILPRQAFSRRPPEEVFRKFNLEIFHTGESMENILKIAHLMESYPDLSLLVQTNPSYCCPSLVTEAMADRIEEITGIPIVTIEYDGTGGRKNEDVVPYLKYLRRDDYGTETGVRSAACR